MKIRNKYNLERVDLGYWILPTPPDPLKGYRKGWERLPKLGMIRTIPFGYVVDPDDEDWMIPVDNELSHLELAKKHVKRHSYADVAAWLSKQTGRYISANGLKKRINIDRRRKSILRIKRFYARRYEKILKQINALEQTRLGKAKEDRSEAESS